MSIDTISSESVPGRATARCCVKCFENATVIEHIEINGIPGLCSFCQTESSKTVEPSILAELFLPALAILVRWSSLSEADRLAPDGGPLDWLYLHEIFQIYWRTFSKELGCSDKCAVLLSCILGSLIEPEASVPQHLNLWVIETSLRSYASPFVQWNILSENLKYVNRYTIGARGLKVDELLNTLLTTERLAQLTLEVSDSFYRARKGRCLENMQPGETVRSVLGAPPRQIGTSGRANAAGIRVLYVARTRETAVAEVRAAVGESVSVVTIQPKYPVKLLDLKTHVPQRLWSPIGNGSADALRQELDFSYALEAIGRQMSRPIQVGDAPIDYVPTQYLAEFVKSKLLDGILYDSSLDGGSNAVLFDCDSVEFSEPEIVRVRQIKYEISSDADYAQTEPANSILEAEQKRRRRNRERRHSLGN